MENHLWKKIVVKDALDYRKINWMKKNKTWLNKWRINLQECPNTNEEF